MPRRTRIHYPGAIYHVMARGVDGRDIYVDDRDRELFLRTLSRLRRESGLSILAFCLMGNHFHLAIKVSDIPLSSTMQRLLTQYALTFNSRHERSGHLFQARYKAILCLNEPHLFGLIRYIHMNPVRAGLTETPGAWKWSSHRSYLGDNGIARIDPLDSLSDQATYSGLMSKGEAGFDPWPRELGPVEGSALVRHESRVRASLDNIAARISGETAISINELRTRGRKFAVSQARRRLIREGVTQGHSLSAVARWLGCTAGTAHFLLNGRTNQKSKA